MLEVFTLNLFAVEIFLKKIDDERVRFTVHMKQGIGVMYS